ncbi:hypothetical protein [Winogradskyella sp. UBA3174]|uniref:hypothetical protein n=1 Tax=Winogradskyella sp. UBA3174 TaxID=1947785 RepID=UPI0025FA0783|nr:hypothetical protein [Winogradskyella sp. UBA3174]|tara:strand:+ start:473 stop:1732 length:1260 start_codon:yes stop_codon:yes gene_type:complete
MKLNKEQLLKINEVNNFIIDYCEIFADNEEELVYSEERIEEIITEEEDIEAIYFNFPGEEEYVEIEPLELINLFDEIKSIEIISNGYIKTNLRRFYIVSLTDSEDEYVLNTFHEVGSSSTNGIKISLLEQSFIVGLSAIKLGEYDSDGYWGTASQYLVIEIEYESKDKVLDKEKELEIINSYIFEVADSTGFSLSLSEIRNPVNDYYDYEADMQDENSSHSLRELEPFNEGMNLFISAVQIKDPELKFLNFYKVLEHFSPIAVNIEANELMRKKLDAPRSLFEDGDYIRSIFELANSMRDRFNDEDLIKASFNTCFDIVGLFDKLPESIKKKIKKHIGASELTYSTDKQKITTSSNIASKIIYKTRNKVVHAKSNFNLTGEEIDSPEFDQLNEFMKEASSQAIRWYSRQPNHLKLEIIK